MVKEDKKWTVAEVVSAARTNPAEAARQMEKAGMNVNEQDRNGNSVLHAAIEGLDLRQPITPEHVALVIKICAKPGLRTDVENNEGVSPIDLVHSRYTSNPENSLVAQMTKAVAGVTMDKKNQGNYSEAHLTKAKRLAIYVSSRDIPSTTLQSNDHKKIPVPAVRTAAPGTSVNVRQGIRLPS